MPVTGTARLPPGVRIYAVGDVHGRFDLIAALGLLIDAHRLGHPPARVIEVYLGDLIDRGPASADVIAHLLHRRGTRDVVTLAGNHELMMMRALVEPETFPDWLASGGRETLLSYGIPIARSTGSDLDWGAMAEAVRQRIPAEHLALCRHLVTSFALGDYFFAHAGVRPGQPLDQQLTEDLAWIRRPFLASQADFGAVVVHGHTPVVRPEVHSNRINIDTGAYATGHLTCLVLEGAEIDFLQT